MGNINSGHWELQTGRWMTEAGRGWSCHPETWEGSGISGVLRVKGLGCRTVAGHIWIFGHLETWEGRAGQHKGPPLPQVKGWSIPSPYLVHT
jgi:hypothetical protein